MAPVRAVGERALTLSRQAEAGGSAGGRRGSGPGSGGWWQRAQPLQGGEKVVRPGPAGGHSQRRCSGGPCQAAGDRQQPSSERPGGADGGVGQPDQRCPAQQVVRERGDDRPRRVGGELARREVRQGLVFEVADRELDDGVPAMLGLDEFDRVGAVGQEREVSPVGPELGLVAEQSGAPDDQPLCAQRGALRFVEELIPRVARAGASGPKLLRADSGFWNKKIMARLQAAGWTYSIGVRQQQHITAAITAIPEQDWRPLEDFPRDGEAQIAQTMLGAQRLIIRRTRLLGDQAELWPDWRHFAFLTNRTDAIELVETEHRQHAVVELAIRDLKDQALAHFPSGKFYANAAWTVIAALAHNLLRWTRLRAGFEPTVDEPPTVDRGRAGRNLS